MPFKKERSLWHAILQTFYGEFIYTAYGQRVQRWPPDSAIAFGVLHALEDFL